jgi:hypothetical protein
MGRLHAFFVVNLLLVLSMGCESGLPKPVMTDVRGQVNLDGKPLKEGRIAFITPGFPSDTLTIADGAFSGKAGVGDNRRVEIYADKEGPLDKDPMTGEPMKTRTSIVAQTFNTNSTLTATVTKDGDNNFKFDVKGP